MSRQTATAPAQTAFAYGDHVTIAVNVTDFERAIAWYREAFGFELIKLASFKDPDGNAFGLAERI